MTLITLKKYVPISFCFCTAQKTFQCSRLWRLYLCNGRLVLGLSGDSRLQHSSLHSCRVLWSMEGHVEVYIFVVLLKKLAGCFFHLFCFQLRNLFLSYRCNFFFRFVSSLPLTDFQFTMSLSHDVPLATSLGHCIYVLGSIQRTGEKLLLQYDTKQGAENQNSASVLDEISFPSRFILVWTLSSVHWLLIYCLCSFLTGFPYKKQNVKKRKWFSMFCP